jgi:hypothetical protein
LTISSKIVIFPSRFNLKKWGTTMPKFKPVVPDRVRNIRQCTFGWIDHNFLHRGFLNRLSQPELLLYYFLITVADRYGVSFYDYVKARDRLCERSLIAFKDGIYQVLPLPNPIEERPAQNLSQRNSTNDFMTLKKVFQNIGC